MKLANVKLKRIKNENIDPSMVKLVLILLLVVIIMGMMIPGLFFTGKNFQSMAFQFPEFGLFAIAMSLAMLTGGCDLSIVSIGNMAAIISGSFILRMIKDDSGSAETWTIIALAVVIALLIGVLAGAINGFCIAVIGIPPILTTLGTMQLFAGVGIVITKGSSLYSFPAELNLIGNGNLLSIIPFPAIIFLLAVLVLVFVIQKCSFGMKLYMIGTNAKASIYSGIKNRGVILRSYMLGGILSAVAGFIILTRTNSANADYGSNYIIQSLLAAIMGGVAPKGGKGKVTGIVLAVLTMQLSSSGLNMLNVSGYFKQFVYGTLLLLLIISNTFSLKNIIKFKMKGRIKNES